MFLTLNKTNNRTVMKSVTATSLIVFVNHSNALINSFTLKKYKYFRLLEKKKITKIPNFVY